MSNAFTHLSATIAAIATPRGQGGVAIIRLSGPQAWAIAQAATQQNASHWQARHIGHGWVFDADGQTLDEVLILPFKGPHSFTGEDVVELHGHGGDYLAHALLQRCIALGAQPAQAGEFTQRACLNGKIDLTQAESIADLIAARSTAMLKAASQNLRGATVQQAFSQHYASIQAIQASIIASIDFPDEVDEPPCAVLLDQLQAILQQLQQFQTGLKRYQYLRDGARLALLGQPNAGKSSLFNALLRQNRAIVTPIAGTTRDVITETLDWGGLPVTFTDTAGLHEGTHIESIEQQGIDRSWQAASGADIVLYLCDLSRGYWLDDADRQHLETLQANSPHTPLVLLGNKADVCRPELPTQKPEGFTCLSISAQQQTGLEALQQYIEGLLPQLLQHEASSQNALLCLNQRQDHCLKQALEALACAQQTISTAMPLDIASACFSEALGHLNALWGHDTTERLLDEVFSRFCVGK